QEMRKVQFAVRADALVQQYPEYQALSWVDERRQILSTHKASSLLHHQMLRAGDALPMGDTETHYSLARDLMQPIYGVIEPETQREGILPMLQMHTPLTNDKGQFSGVLMAEYTLEGLLRYGIPTEILAKFAISMVNPEGQILAGQTIPERSHALGALPWPRAAANEYRVPVSPVGNGLLLRAQTWRTSTGVVGNAQFWMVAALGVMTAWMLIANWRHSRRRLQAQKALIAETNFRRAMENSMLTGMRALDMQGRITYVNAAFCEMTGWSEAELVGATAPFPYWPEQDHEQLMKRLEDELRGLQSPGGFQVRVKRRNGQLFDARMYVSPLVDATGKQTGWMTSMTDITEPNRIREQLASSHERFTIVLEALDASVSVAPLGSKELLFANKLYRQWFGQDTQGHLQLVEQAGAY
ncbi:MAG: PAS domain-containing protein, partial [Burkholderiaceae bacterium]